MWPAVAGDHPRHRQLRAEDHPMQVDVDHPPRRHVVLVNEAPHRHDPGVVDQDVDRPQLLFGLVQEAREGLPVGHVQRQRHRGRAQLGSGRLGRRQVHVADRHPHPLAHQGLGRRAADTARGARYGGGLSGEDTGLLGHLVLLISSGSRSRSSIGWSPKLAHLPPSLRVLRSDHLRRTCRVRRRGAPARANHGIARARVRRTPPRHDPATRGAVPIPINVEPVGSTRGEFSLRGAADRIHRVRRRARRRHRRRQTWADRACLARRRASRDPRARAAALPGDAPAAGRRPRRAREPGDHHRPARARRIRSPARHVALLHAFFAEQIVALMDHLEIEQAVVMGTSLGANAALEIALQAPERLPGWSSRCPCSTTPSRRPP